MFNLLAPAPAPFDFAGIFADFFSRWYYYVSLAIFIAVLVVFCFLKKTKRNNLSPTQKIVYTAFISALCAIANYATFKASDVLQISFVATTGFLAGYLLGAGSGFAASFIGDLICGIIAPFGAYNPILGIGTGLWGLVPGIIFTHVKGNDYIKTIMSFVICFFLNSFAVNTLGLSLMYSMTFESLMALLPYKLAVVVGNAVISIALLAVLRRILPKDKFYISDTTASKDESSEEIE